MKKLLLGLLIAAALVQSCKKDDNKSPVTKMTLYDSLGGVAKIPDPANAGQMIETGRLGIRSVVDSAIFVIAGDPAISSYFSTLLTEVTAGNTSGFMMLSKNLTDFFCVATGAKNFTYGGKNMTDAHDPAKNPRMSAKADNAAFDAFVADLVTAAKKNHLTDLQISRIGAVVGTLRTTVVQR